MNKCTCKFVMFVCCCASLCVY